MMKVHMARQIVGVSVTKMENKNILWAVEQRRKMTTQVRASLLPDIV